jgi:tetratricopeptide (TPR) repeat protein
MTAETQVADTPRELHRQAIQARKGGDLQKAERLLRQALSQRPGHMDCLRTLADLLVQTGRPAQAMPAYEALLGARPDDADLLHNRGVALMALGRPAEAVTSLDAAIAINPQYASAFYNRGVALQTMKRPVLAANSYARAVEIRPDDVGSLNNLGALLMALGRPADALARFDRVLKLRPDDVGALGNRANALSELGRPEQALTSAARALELQPDNLAALANLGNALRQLGRFQEALQAFDRALKLKPDYPEGHNNRGNVLWELGLQDQALATYEQALKLRPDYPEALSNRGNALRELGRVEEALASLDRAIQLAPRYADAWENKAVTLAELGQVDEASEAIRTVIALAPWKVRPHQVLTELKRITAEDPSFKALQQIAKAPEKLNVQERVSLGYALGKAYADLGDHETAFTWYADGAARQRARLTYDEAAGLQALEAVKKGFGRALIKRKAGKGDPSPVPVFVFGMPRSGTTLIEQILSRHPKVFAAGETPLLGEVLDDEVKALGKAVMAPEEFAPMPAEELARLGTDYVERLRRLAPDAERVVNKTPINFAVAGLIHLMLPNARLIHARRDPADTCVSCFTRLFVDDLPYTYDLGELGRYYRAYEALMDHWRKALPAGVMIDVQYEDVVDDLEGQARRIVAHCGLEWDPACLDFHKAERQVRTASTLQVRQPLFKSSVGRWKAYEPHLAPLLEALGRK